MSYSRLLRRAFLVTLLLSGGIASGLVMFSVIALTGGLSRPGESAAKETASEQTAAEPTAGKQVDQRAPEVDRTPDNNPGQAETQYAAVSEPGATIQKAKKVRHAEPERAVEIVKKGAGSGSSPGAGDANASGSGSGAGAGSGSMAHGSPSAGGGFQVPGGGGFGVGGGSNQSPSGTRPAPAAGAPANPPQTRPAPVLPLAGPTATETPAPPASPPIIIAGPGLPPVLPPQLPDPAPLPPQANAPAVPIPTPPEIIAANDPLPLGDGVLRPGHSPGTANVCDLTKYHAIEIEIAGAADGQFDVVIVDCPVASFPVGLKISFILLNAYVPASGADFEFLFANALEGEENISYFLDPGTSVLPAGFEYQVYADGESDLHVRVYNANSPPEGYVHDLYTGQVVVPEPSTTALGLLGLALLGWRMRRPLASTKD